MGDFNWESSDPIIAIFSIGDNIWLFGPRPIDYYFWLGREAEEMHYSWRVGNEA